MSMTESIVSKERWLPAPPSIFGRTCACPWVSRVGNMKAELAGETFRTSNIRIICLRMAENSGSDQAAALGSALRMIRRDIERAIAPETHSALAKDTITSLTLILDELADYFSSDPDPEAARSRA